MSAERAYQSSPAEASRVFHAIFGGTPPPLLVERFIAASDRLNATAATDALAEYYRVVASGRDLEALELAGRYRRRLPLLSAKFRLMVYLAETVPELQGYFVNRNDDLGAAIWALAAGAVRTGWKLMKGLVLISGAPNV